MSRQLPPLNALKAFEAAARHLSFTKAAEELFVTQAAISHQIKTLEEYLGLKLFRRRNRSLSLTEDGQGYYQEIRSIFSAICDATERLMARNAKGTLTITMPPGFAIQWMVPRLMQFSQLHPEIDVRIKAVDQDEGTLIDDVDLAIYYGDGNWPDLLLYKLHSGYRIPAGTFPYYQKSNRLFRVAMLIIWLWLPGMIRRERLRHSVTGLWPCCSRKIMNSCLGYK